MQLENGTPAAPPADSMARALEEYLAAAEAGTAPPREQFLARHPGLAEDLDACLAALQFIGRAAEGPRSVAAGVAEAPPPEPAPGRLGDFRLIREVGRGGMGVVYEAEQVSLGRRVALKVLPFAATMDPRQLQRFHNEARAAALLDHPHIVHVHAVGCERAVHYYAMQFIDGQTLAELIAELRRAGGRPLRPEAQPTTPHVPGQPAVAETAPPARASTERAPLGRAHFRRVAELGVQAAEALDYAHALGIVHRDVKPANLLVDGRGGLWVADFGLAQVLSDARLTLTGDLVGTLRYMSPEQALAKRVVVDHRTDVYSLGATLYELLTLEPAFGGDDRQELLRQIAFEEPRPLRPVNKAVPAELETIVLKAMAKEPADRYATAQELADDLRRFLEDKAILAKRPTLGRQLARWSRRHKAAVLSAGLVLLALLGGIAVSTWQAVRATDAEGQAKSGLAEARQAGQQTLDALRDLTDEVLERHMARQAQLTEEDRAFLRKVLGHYEGFAATKGDGPESRAVRAEGYFRVGTLRLRLGEQQEALSAYEHALALRKQLAADFPTVPDYRKHLALSHHNLGYLLRDLGKREEAEAEYRQALALQAQLAADFPTVPDYRQHLARSHQNLGNLLTDLRRGSEAEAEHRQALALKKQLAADFPAVPAYRHELAGSHNDLGQLLSQLGNREEAEEEYRQALALSEQLAADFPSVPTYREFRAHHHHNVGNLLADLGKGAEAEAHYRQALALRKQLAADFPTVPTYRKILAGDHNQLGNLLAKLGKRLEAQAEFRQALELQKQLAADFPTVPDYRHELAGSHNNLGLLLADLGKGAEAQEEYRQAIALSQRLTSDFPTVPTYRAFLANHHNNLGNLLKSLGKGAEAQEEYRQGLALQEQLAADFPTVPDYRKDLALAHHNLGSLLRILGKREEAESEYRQALALQKQLAADFPTVPDYRKYLAYSHNNLGDLLTDLGKGAEAEAQYRQALALRKQLAADFSTVPDYRHELAGSHHNLGSLLKNLGKHTEGEEEYRQAIALSQRLTSDFPTVPTYRAFLANHHNHLGNLLRDLGKQAEAEAECRQALALQKQLAADFPTVPDYRKHLALSHHNLGILLKNLGKQAEAEAEYRQALALQKQLAADFPTVPDYQVDLGGSYCNLGNLVKGNNRPADALPLYDQAIEVLAPLVEREPRLVTARLFLRNSHWGRAKGLMQLDRFTEADRDWDQAVALADGSTRADIRLQRATGLVRLEPKKAMAEADAVLQGNLLSPVPFYDSACVYALSSARIQDAALSDEYAARAVALLRQAREKGYFNAPVRVEHMKKDADLDLLRGRADYQKLLAELEAAKK
jgi:serine/threonine protein kinase/Flp pilus assembly protein TadD